MEQKKCILIADGSAKFCDELTQALMKCDGFEIAGTTNDGEQAIKLVKKTEPDVLVLDLMLPGLDGISILEEASRCGLHPMVLATTKFNNDFMVEAAVRLGVSYMMVKPCDLKATAQRLQDLAEHLEQPVVVLPEPRTVVSNIHAQGTPAVEAGAYIAELIEKILKKKVSGVGLHLEDRE